MLKRDALIQYLARYMEIDKIKDSAVSGLQVEGREEVRKIVTSVSASEQLFKKAAALHADLVIVHHGILWEGQKGVVRGSFRKRISALLESNMTLLGYHLPLDRHPVIGNNMLSAKGLGLSSIKPFGSYHNAPIGFRGRLTRALPAKEFFARVNAFYGVNARIFPSGPSQVKTVGIVTGGAARMVSDAILLKLDAFITGEPGESAVQECREEGIHYIAGGHYATERLGIRALGKHIAARFKVDVEYVDVPVAV